ncbi:MAG: hypothetical protein P8166_10565, partial [Candidatus Thiodiazotropha sp.]
MSPDHITGNVGEINTKKPVSVAHVVLGKYYTDNPSCSAMRRALLELCNPMVINDYMVLNFELS